MIDRDKRECLRQLLIALREGQCSYRRLSDDDFTHTEDTAVTEIWLHFIDEFENDLSPEATIRAMPDAIQAIDRCELFLRTDDPYSWPRYPSGSAYRRFILIGFSVVGLLVSFPVVGRGFFRSALIILLASATILAIGLWHPCASQGVESWAAIRTKPYWPFVPQPSSGTKFL